MLKNCVQLKFCFLYKAGTISQFVHCWTDITNDEYILSVVEHSVCLPFLSQPESFELPNKVISQKHDSQ